MKRQHSSSVLKDYDDLSFPCLPGRKNIGYEGQRLETACAAEMTVAGAAKRREVRLEWGAIGSFWATWIPVMTLDFILSASERPWEVLSWGVTCPYSPIKSFKDLPGDPGVKVPCSQCSRHGFNPWSRTKISHAARCSRE